MNRKRFASLSIAITLLAFGASANAQESKAYLHNYNVPASGVALEGYCPVAYFAANKPIRGKRQHAVEHNDVWYFFVNEDAKREFESNPKKYLPAYGGWCALGMALEDKFPVDPTNFKIVNGRLMLFLKNKNIDALKLWNQDKETELVRKADAFWNTKVNK
ncbi:MAG: hypothetical protein MI861_24235 [Pirellulales bacterium]|nr:hypothetical protein [Pirellulales bacterium]